MMCRVTPKKKHSWKNMKVHPRQPQHIKDIIALEVDRMQKYVKFFKNRKRVGTV